MGLKRRSGGRWWASLPFRVVLAAAALALSWGAAHAQTAFNDCSQTVGLTAAPVVFPAAGKTGPPAPTTFLEICVAVTTGAPSLGVNYVGGTAALPSQGTVRLLVGSGYPCIRWEGQNVPQSVSVVSSSASTPTACAYK